MTLFKVGEDEQPVAEVTRDDAGIHLSLTTTFSLGQTFTPALAREVADELIEQARLYEERHSTDG